MSMTTTDVYVLQWMSVVGYGCLWMLIDVYECNHRHQKAKIDCLSFVMCPLLAQPIIAFFSSFFAAAVYSTNEANKADGMRR
jgi:hypothetical protein